MTRMIGWLDRLFVTLAGASLVMMTLLSFVDSIGRQIGSPLPGASEYVSFAMCILFFATMPLLTRDNQHIRVGLLVEAFPAGLARVERVVTAVVELACLGLITWLLIDQADRLFRFGSLTRFLEVPIYPIIALSAILMGAAVLHGLRNVRCAIGPDAGATTSSPSEKGK